MATIETGKTVLHRGREAREILKEETAELADAEQEQAQPDGANEQRIAEAAYYIAERRNFAPGRELEDWLEAEASVRAPQ